MAILPFKWQFSIILKREANMEPDFRKNPYFLVVYIGIIFFESSFPSWHCV